MRINAKLFLAMAMLIGLLLYASVCHAGDNPSPDWNSQRWRTELRSARDYSPETQLRVLGKKRAREQRKIQQKNKKVLKTKRHRRK
jgi:hypothetical protein